MTKKIQTPQINLPSQIKPKPFPKNVSRCFECQGYGHTSADCTNRRVITLAEWETIGKEEETEGSVMEEEKEEVVVHANEGDMLDLKPLLEFQRRSFQPHFKAQTTSSQKALKG